MNRRFPLQSEGLFCGFACDAGCGEQLNGGNDDLANRHQRAVLEDAIPDADIPAPCGFGDRNVHVKSGHSVGVEILHYALPNQKLRRQPSISYRHRTATIDTTAKIRASVVLEQHYYLRQ